jgi:hypothetical protein
MIVAALSLVAATVVRAQNPPTVPVPKPFPGSGGQTAPPVKPTPPPGSATEPAPVPPPVGTPTVQELAGTPVYPNAEFVDSFDAGRGQRYYLYGTNSSYSDIVLYYRNVLKSGANRELFRVPAMHQFDLGRYQEETMAYPPSVVVKDYSWNDSPGYLFVKGTTEKRFKTIIQIVPK